MISRRRLLVSAGVTGCPFGTAFADGAHVAFSIVEHNDRAQTLEVIHRLMALDFELALTARTGQRIRIDEIMETAGEEVVAQYLDTSFSISTADGTPLSLQWVGMAFEIDNVLIYQEAAWPAAATGFVIKNQILTEVHPTQVNIVNVSAGGRTQTRTFTLGDPPQQVDFG